MSACRYKLKQDQYLIFGSVTRKFVLFLGFSVSVFFFFFIAASLRCLVIVTDALIFFLQFMWKMKFFGTNKEIPLPSLSLSVFFFHFPCPNQRKAQTLPTAFIPASDWRRTKGLAIMWTALNTGRVGKRDLAEWRREESDAPCMFERGD